MGPYVPEPLEHSVLGLSMHTLEHSGADRSVGPSIDLVGPVGLYVTRGPVSSYGTLSPCDSDADQPVTDGPVGPCVACGLVGSYGVLSPCNSEFDPDQLRWCEKTVGSYVSCGPVSSSGTLSPGDSDTTGPVMPMKTLPLSPHGGGECMDRNTSGRAPTLRRPLPLFTVVNLWAGSTVSDVSSNGGDDGEDWDSGYQREIIYGVTVYYGGDLCDSDDSEESDWEDPEDVARREYVEDYNFDLLEGMEPMVFVPSGKTSGRYRQNEYQSYLYDGNDTRVPEFCKIRYLPYMTE